MEETQKLWEEHAVPRRIPKEEITGTLVWAARNKPRRLSRTQEDVLIWAVYLEGQGLLRHHPIYRVLGWRIWAAPDDSRCKRLGLKEIEGGWDNVAKRALESLEDRSLVIIGQPPRFGDWHMRFEVTSLGYRVCSELNWERSPF